jgi:hypothetical protein
VRRARLTAGIGAVAFAMALAGGALTTPVAASGPYVDADLGEVPTAIAVSDAGVMAASLYNAQRIALVDPDGAVRSVGIGCSPADVAISPAGTTAWAVCQEGEHLIVIDVPSAGVAQFSLGVTGLDDVVYLPAIDQLVVASIEGYIFVVAEVAEGNYVIRAQVTLPRDKPFGVTELAAYADARGAYAITDDGSLIYVDLKSGGRVILIARGSPRRQFASIALGPVQTMLVATTVNGSAPAPTTSVEVIDMATGAARHSVALDIDQPFFTTVQMAAGHRSIFLSVGAFVRTPTGLTGMLTVPVSVRGTLGPVESADVPPLPAAAVSLSSDGQRVAFGTTIATALGITAVDAPYPTAIRVSARAKGGKVTVTGTTTSLAPLTALTVHVKDLTKKKSTFTKQSRKAMVDRQGDIRWTGKAPSKRFALYLEGGGARSKTVTVTRR